MSTKKTPVDVLMDAVKWESIPAGPAGETDANHVVPYATHTGVLHVGTVALRVYQLNDGQRIINAEDFETFFGALESDP